MKINKIINEAKRLLQENPYDEGHDLTHHLEVWGNAQDIANNINIEVDKDALYIACMWHDVVITDIEDRNFKQRGRIVDSTSNYLEGLLRKDGFSDSFIDKTILAIRLHEYKRKPTTVEGKILYDADKLEYIGLNRWKRIFHTLKTGKMSKIKFFIYKQAGKRYLKHLKEKYHFDYTRELHDERVKLILQDKEARQMAKELGENLESILVG